MRNLIALSPSFLAACGAAVHNKAADAFISSVIDFHKIVRRGVWFDFLVSSEAVAALYESGRYPIREVFYELTRQRDAIGEYTPEDLARMFRSILERSQETKEYFGIEDILLGEDFQINPPTDFDPPHEKLLQYELEHFACCAIANGDHIERAAQIVVCTLLEEGQELIDVRGTIQTMVPTLVPDNTVVETKLEATTQSTPFLDALDPLIIWQKSETVEELYLAILLRVFQEYRQANPVLTWRQIREKWRTIAGSFSMGSSFLPSLRENAAWKDKEFSSQTFEVCWKLINQTPKQPLRPFRQAADPNSAVRIRHQDGAEGFRTHITGANEGLRLMVWRLGNRLELANVGPKNELIIETGSSNQTFFFDDSD